MGIDAEIINIHTIKPDEEVQSHWLLTDKKKIAEELTNSRFEAMVLEYSIALVVLKQTQHPEYVAVNDSFGESGTTSIWG